MLYEYNKQCFGISFPSGIFHRIIKNLLEDIPGVACFLDDVLITGQTKEHHMYMIRKVLKKLKESGLRLNYEKCEWLMDELQYLGLTKRSSNLLQLK